MIRAEAYVEPIFELLPQFFEVEIDDYAQICAKDLRWNTSTQTAAA